MKFFMLTLMLLLSQPLAAQLNVFACEPEWAALAKEIGGDKLNIYQATTGLQDPHHIQARPSLISKARRSDILFCAGAELEIGWLPILLRKSANAKIQPGQDGHFMATDHVTLLNKMEKVDRSMGDVHTSGNPHIHLNPYNILQVARAFANTLSNVDSSNRAYYEQSLKTFQQKWQQAISQWEDKAQPLKGKHYIVYHKSWAYLADWLKVDMNVSMEPKPGIPPGAEHLSHLVSHTQNTNISKIIYAANKNPKAANWLSDKTSIPATKLAFTVGGNKESDSLFTLFDDTINRLIN